MKCVLATCGPLRENTQQRKLGKHSWQTAWKHPPSRERQWKEHHDAKLLKADITGSCCSSELFITYSTVVHGCVEKIMWLFLLCQCKTFKQPSPSQVFKVFTFAYCQYIYKTLSLLQTLHQGSQTLLNQKATVCLGYQLKWRATIWYVSISACMRFQFYSNGNYLVHNVSQDIWPCLYSRCDVIRLQLRDERKKWQRVGFSWVNPKKIQLLHKPLLDKMHDVTTVVVMYGMWQPGHQSQTLVRSGEVHSHFTSFSRAERQVTPTDVSESPLVSPTVHEQSLIKCQMLV